MRGRLVMLIETAAVAALVTVAASTRVEAQAAASDARQRVALPATGRDKILTEMRVMLESLHGVVRAVAAQDLAAAEKAARVSGMATAADVDPEIKRRLPPPFLQLGMQTHLGFDRLAERLRAGGPPADLLAGVAAVTANCVACHAAYRLDEAR